MSKNTPKASSADYPVAETELVSQQNRLRRAAAAGAEALKAPAGLAGPSSATTVMPQKPVASQAVSSQIPQSREAASEPEPAAPPDVPARAEVRQFNDNEAVLVELRRISAWADVQRKTTRGSLIFAAVFIPALIVFGILLERQVSSTNVESTTPPEKPGWYDMDRNVRSGEFDKAIAIGEELLLKTPQYPEAHKRLAGAYLAVGNLEKAREHYAEAFRLFPSEENEKLLLALDKRSTTEKP